MPMDWDEFKSQKSSGGGGPSPEFRMPEFRMPKIPKMKLPTTFVLLIILVLWFMSGIFSVGPDEQGIFLRFGKLNRTVSSCLNYHYPIYISNGKNKGIRNVESSRSY